MDNINKSDKAMLDPKFLFQPRGQGTAYLFRMATPAFLIGKGTSADDREYLEAYRTGALLRR